MASTVYLFREIHRRSTFVENQIAKQGKITEDVKIALAKAKSLEEIESLVSFIIS